MSDSGKIKILIIGAGASGSFLSCLLDDSKYDVTIFEKNSKIGKKLLLTGNGKCNFTNGDFSDLDKIYHNADFVKYAIGNFGSKSFIEFMNSIGIEERKEIHHVKEYFYPRTEKATSVYYDLLDKIQDKNINLILNQEVLGIRLNKNNFVVKSKNEGGRLREDEFDKVVVATGGASYKNTGSDASFFRIIKELGINVKDLYPSLCGLIPKNNKLKDIKGVRINAKASLYIDEEYISSEYGEIQFTSYGLSGIPIMNISRYVKPAIVKDSEVIIKINFFVNDEEDYIKSYDLEKFLTECLKKIKVRSDELKYKRAEDFLCGYINEEIANIIYDKLKINKKYVKDLSDDELLRIAKELYEFDIEIDDTEDINNAQVTRGGVDTKEVDNKTFMSKKIKNLYFIGEVLDIDGICGGYNLQFAYSSSKALSENL